MAKKGEGLGVREGGGAAKGLKAAANFSHLGLVSGQR